VPFTTTTHHDSTLRRARPIVALIAAVSVGLAWACGGKTSSGDGGGQSATGPTATASATATATATTTPTGAPPPPTPPPDTLVPSPGRVACGAVTCDVDAGAACCPWQATPSCATPTGCPGYRTCDDSADCASGEQCCGFAGSSGGPTAACSTTPCTSLSFAVSFDSPSRPADHLCARAAECGPSERCAATTDEHGITYGVCSKL
jgi:hypothetical protein